VATPSNGSSGQAIAIDRQAVIDAAATLDAAANILAGFNEGAETPLQDFLSRAAWELHAAAFGKLEGEAYDRHPAVVEVYVRSYMIAAAALAPVAARGRDYEEEARRIEEAGTVNLPVERPLGRGKDA
jgi:hypothetical protein